MNEAQLKQLFLRFIKEDGSYSSWKYYIEKKNRSLDDIIYKCINLKTHSFACSTITLRNKQKISTPFFIECKYKRFCNTEVYEHAKIHYGDSKHGTQGELFANQLKKNKL